MKRDAHQAAMAKAKTRTTVAIKMAINVAASRPEPIEMGGGGPALDRTGGSPGGKPTGAVPLVGVVEFEGGVVVFNALVTNRLIFLDLGEGEP